MRSLIVFLLILGVYSACLEDEFDLSGVCVDCMMSPCEECQGTATCKSCPSAFKQDGSCKTCAATDTVAFNKKCVKCSTFGSSERGLDETTCLCKDGETGCCTKDSGGYLVAGVCTPCSFATMGCEQCTLTISSGTSTFKCDSCISGYHEEEEGGITVCLPGDSAAHLISIVGLLISLLILL